MKKLMIAGALLTSAMVTPLQTVAADELNEKLLKCFEMTDESQRVVCYDEISRSIAQANPEKQELVKKRAIADFGLVHQEQTNSELIMQTASVKREPGGLWLITMDNGQVWKQTKEERFSFSSDQPKVRIFKLLLGSYAMQEDGRTKKIRVKRIK